uniref:Uncharacterized protein n=1 Tax=Anguilla anguilla TaxID=7936 RepID=A0A0E9WTH8_ANGAN
MFMFSLKSGIKRIPLIKTNASSRLPDPFFLRLLSRTFSDDFFFFLFLFLGNSQEVSHELA